LARSSRAGGSGTVQGLHVSKCGFLEILGTGAAATDAWDGAGSGPANFDAATDQYLMSDCFAGTDAASVFADLIVSAGNGEIAGCYTGTGNSSVAAVYSDTTLIEATTTTIASDTLKIETDVDNILSDTLAMTTVTDTIASDLIVVDTICDTITSDLIVCASDCVEIQANLDQVHSETTQIQSNSVKIESDVVAMATQMTTVASDLVVVVSDTLKIEADVVALDTVCDTVASDLIVVDATADTIASDLIVVDATADTIASDVVVLVSDCLKIETDVDNILSDTLVIEAWGMSGVAADTVAVDAWQTRCVRAAAVSLTGGSGPVADVFTIANGPIMLLGIFAHVDTVVDAACTAKWQHDPSGAGSATDICTALDANTDAAGDVFYVSGASGDPLARAATGTVNALGCDENGQFLMPGGIDLVLANSDPTTGEWDVYMWYKPLLAAVTVT